MKSHGLTRSRERWGLVFVLPQLLSLLFLGVIPIVIAFGLSFYQWNGFTGATFTGLDNFRAVFANADTGTAVKNTLVFVVSYVPATILLALVLSLLLNKVAGKVTYRAIFFTPQIVNSVAVSVIWLWIFQPQYGLLNALLQAVGLVPQEWLKNPDLAMTSVVIMSVWWGMGYNIVLFLAGLQNVPRTYIEAATIDGAGEWQIFRHITLPMISPTMLFVTITTLINAFQAFDQMLLLTDGGPIKRTYTLTLHIYKTAFKFFEIGRASTIALILFAIVVAISVVQYKLSDRWVYYE